MRQCVRGGTCGQCGHSSPDGAFWRPRHLVLDLGVGDGPREYGDLGEPVLCDRCNSIDRDRVYREAVARTGCRYWD